jgi:hypothetical protein
MSGALAANLTPQHFGACPECGRPGISLTVDRDNWYVCEACETKWSVGWNLFTPTAYQLEPAYIHAMRHKLSRYREVESAMASWKPEAAPWKGSTWREIVPWAEDS